DREELLALVGLEREPLSARAGDHDAVDALADDPLDELGPAVEVERAAGVEGRRHRRDVAAPADALTVHAQSALTSIASVPPARTTSLSPGSSSVVESSSSRIAGPSSEAPGPSAALRSTRASCTPLSNRTGRWCRSGSSAPWEWSADGCGLSACALTEASTSS